MSGSFVHEITADAVEIRLLGPRGPIPAEAWALTAPTEALPGVDLAQRLIAAGSAITEGDTLFVEHATIAGLSGREAALIGLPSIADVVAVIETHGIVTQPSFAAGLRWQRPNGQAVIGAGRTGAFLRIGQAWFRLPDILYQIAEAVDRLASLRIEDVGARLAAISALAEVLPHAGGAADAPNILGKMTIAVADPSPPWRRSGSEAAVRGRAGCVRAGPVQPIRNGALGLHDRRRQVPRPSPAATSRAGRGPAAAIGALGHQACVRGVSAGISSLGARRGDGWHAGRERLSRDGRVLRAGRGARLVEPARPALDCPADDRLVRAGGPRRSPSATGEAARRSRHRRQKDPARSSGSGCVARAHRGCDRRRPPGRLARCRR